MYTWTSYVLAGTHYCLGHSHFWKLAFLNSLHWCLDCRWASFTRKQPQDGSASEQFFTGKEAQPLTKKTSLSEGLVDLILSTFIIQKVWNETCKADWGNGDVSFPCYNPLSRTTSLSKLLSLGTHECLPVCLALRLLFSVSVMLSCISATTSPDMSAFHRPLT